MKYIIVEMQTTAQDQTSILTSPQATRNEADSAFYQALSSAAVSSVPQHSVTMMTSEGEYIDSKCYHHDIVGGT